MIPMTTTIMTAKIAIVKATKRAIKTAILAILIVGVVVMPTLTSVIVNKICRTLSALAHRIHSSHKPKTARRSKK